MIYTVYNKNKTISNLQLNSTFLKLNSLLSIAFLNQLFNLKKSRYLNEKHNTNIYNIMV